MNRTDPAFTTSCPVCGEVLQASPERNNGLFSDSPSMRLEVSAGPDARHPFGWRLDVIGDDLVMVSSETPFAPRDVADRYLLCGGGHVFQETAGRTPEVYSMVAAIGTPAGGKSYLLARMLGQDLNRGVVVGGPARQIAPWSNWDPLERRAAELLREMYRRSQRDGDPIDPTGERGNELMPRTILAREVSDEIADRVAVELARVVTPDGQPRRWGLGFRQPIVQVLSVGNTLTWNGIADLPGEIFRVGGYATKHHRKALSRYDALIWVVDPAVSRAFDGWFARALPDETDRETVLNGSMRPASTHEEGTKSTQLLREGLQKDLAGDLASEGASFAREDGPGLRLLVAVSKCDLLHLGLREGLSLGELGEHDALRDGVAGYLEHVAGQHAAGMLAVVGVGAEDLIGRYLYAGGPETRRARCELIADALVAHFGSPDAFWRLVQHGGSDLVHVAGVPGDRIRTTYRIELPPLAEHLDLGLRPGNANALQQRDLVMSALGCGLLHALGLGDEAIRLLRRARDHGEVRFFVCSPLAAVPRERPDGEHRYIDVRQGQGYGLFPGVDDPSAALTQLRLASLWRALR